MRGVRSTGNGFIKTPSEINGVLTLVVIIIFVTASRQWFPSAATTRNNMPLLSDQITKLERFKKTLGNLSFSAVIDKNGNWRVKYLKKIVIAECPNQVIAESFSESLNHVVKNTQNRVNDILSHLSVKCEQLELFVKGTLNATSTESREVTQGRTVNPNNIDPTGKELSEGFFDCSQSGREFIQHGSTGIG
jgi:hypothetical protein